MAHMYADSKRKFSPSHSFQETICIRNLGLEKHNSQAKIMKFYRVVLVLAESGELSSTKEERRSSHLFMSRCFKKI